MDIEVLEEKVLYLDFQKMELLRLVKVIEIPTPQYRIEISYSERTLEPMLLSFWQRLKWAFSRKPYPIEVSYQDKYQSVFILNDADPKDPYAENCVREVWDYLTKDYTTNI